MFITSTHITEINKQRRIKEAQKALWNMLCAATPTNFHCFIIPEYEEFKVLGHMLSDFTQCGEPISFMAIEEKFLFISFLIDAFPDLIDCYGNTKNLRSST